jgi:ankyrin repeat protein
MAIIQDDANGVEHMLNRTPAAIVEIDVFGQTPFHLAAANPPILEILLRYGNRSILDRRDMSGFTALETAMIHTSDYCDNGLGTD